MLGWIYVYFSNVYIDRCCCCYYKGWFVSFWQLLPLNPSFLSQTGRLCAPLVLTTGVYLNWGPPYGEKYTQRKYIRKAHTHPHAHKRGLRVKCRLKSDVAEWSWFRWKKFFLTSAGCWAAAGSYGWGFANGADAEARPPDMEGKSLKSKRWGREREKEVRRQERMGVTENNSVQTRKNLSKMSVMCLFFTLVLAFSFFPP